MYSGKIGVPPGGGGIVFYERLTGTMVGFEKVGKRRVPFAVQCKYTKCTIQPCLKYYLLVVN
jgi:hypothetical protein